MELEILTFVPLDCLPFQLVIEIKTSVGNSGKIFNVVHITIVPCGSKSV